MKKKLNSIAFLVVILTCITNARAHVLDFSDTGLPSSAFAAYLTRAQNKTVEDEKMIYFGCYKAAGSMRVLPNNYKKSKDVSGFFYTRKYFNHDFQKKLQNKYSRHDLIYYLMLVYSDKDCTELVNMGFSGSSASAIGDKDVRTYYNLD